MEQFFTIPVVVAILLAIMAFILVMEPENLSENTIENRLMKSQFKSSKHKWEKSNSKSFYFCYLCHKLINSWFSSDVLECKKCGIIIHKVCKFLKLRKPQCKYIIAKHIEEEEKKFCHQWRQCSYNSSTNCSMCNTLCVGFETYLCIWCHRTKHGSCSDNEVECDFGSLRKFILEPTQVRCPNVATFTLKAFTSLRKSRKKIKQKTSDDDSQTIQNGGQQIQFRIKDKTKYPIVVIINKKSGGQTGNQFISAFYQSLNPLQVISILDEGLQKLKIFKNVPNVFFLIAGGDGTICSVLNYIKTIPGWQRSNPPAAILPLGTGNDLSRSLGWGHTADEVNPQYLIPQIFKNGKIEVLDRWKLLITKGQQEKEFTLYNYLGLGLDAKICKDFHDARQKYPKLFFSQFSNKFIYSQMGAVDLIKGSSGQLSELVELRVDGKLISLQQIQNIILLNIKHWGGGVTGLWSPKKEEDFIQQSYSDGLLQVIGLSDVIHMGQVQVGLDSPLQLAQGKQIQIKSLSSKSIIPIQIDGEPLQVVGSVVIRVQRKDQVNVLATNSSEEGKILNVLMEGMKQKIIDEKQMQALMGISKTQIRR